MGKNTFRSEFIQGMQYVLHYG